MINAYINGTPVHFSGETMIVQFTSKTRKLNAPELRNIPGKYGYFVYEITYSPAAKSAINGIPAHAVSADDLPFVKELLGGVKLASVYAEMKTKYDAMQARRTRSTRSECTCGRCFDCVAQ